MKNKELHLRLLYSAKLLFRMEGQKRCFPHKVKLKEFITTKPLLYEMLKGLTKKKKKIKNMNSKLNLASMAQWTEHCLWTKESPVRFLVRAHVWIAGQVPSRGVWEAITHWCFSPSLSTSLPLYLKINKYIFKIKKGRTVNDNKLTTINNWT